MAICGFCGKDMSGIRPFSHYRRWCSPRCRREGYAKDYRKKNPKTDLPSGVVGSMHELMVCIDLMKRKFNVFRAVSQSCPCDLGVLIGDRMVRIEVTTGNKSLTGSVNYPPHDHKKYDILAVVLHNGSIVYKPNIEEFTLLPPSSPNYPLH